MRLLIVGVRVPHASKMRVEAILRVCGGIHRRTANETPKKVRLCVVLVPDVCETAGFCLIECKTARTKEMVAECVWAGTQQHVRSFTLPKRRESWSIYMTLGHACLRDIYERHLDACDEQLSDSHSFIDRQIDLEFHRESLTARYGL